MFKLYRCYHFYIRRTYWKFKELNLKDQIIIYSSLLINGISYGLIYLAIVKEGFSIWLILLIFTNLDNTYKTYKNINLCFNKLMLDRMELVLNSLKNNEDR
ncbi:hypothetical protein CWE04_11570 [Thomasclavelia cocleata]|uniref:Uncharacterized protein n=1 Tax=Thomasclavelia cocleata TaxID=69824 RepID=A0A1I0GCB4_9FIRM|nr:hypothetical protein [Thomasclavelia cocleata]MCR1959837.1 hypothetical protein [Thomasclavelia cocleata]NDO43187.1 hypothetical protein [Thomasclavelia cocleata]PJN79841.1 hypothetical protein CWE04_11570 [Thomasclavelia cocleata]SET68408.1 hypothetical protein SAMN04489758_12812 [Thomasclavelia cocleata]